jgi:DNA-directed RNA polymerase beta' subunit
MNLIRNTNIIHRHIIIIIVHIKNHIISPKDSKPIVNLKQDALLGSYKLTNEISSMNSRLLLPSMVDHVNTL